MILCPLPRLGLFFISGSPTLILGVPKLSQLSATADNNTTADDNTTAENSCDPETMDSLAIIFCTLNSPLLARYSLLSYVAHHLQLRPLTRQRVTLTFILTLLAFYQDLVSHLLGPDCPFLLLLGSILQAFACGTCFTPPVEVPRF